MVVTEQKVVRRSRKGGMELRDHLQSRLGPKRIGLGFSGHGCKGCGSDIYSGALLLICFLFVSNLHIISSVVTHSFFSFFSLSLSYTYPG